jgi:hypothetical protein
MSRLWALSHLPAYRLQGLDTPISWVFQNGKKCLVSLSFSALNLRSLNKHAYSWRIMKHLWDTRFSLRLVWYWCCLTFRRRVVSEIDANVWEKHAVSILRAKVTKPTNQPTNPADGGSTYLWNVGLLQRDYMLCYIPEGSNLQPTKKLTKGGDLRKRKSSSLARLNSPCVQNA